MPDNCKDCKFYGKDVDTVGRCLNYLSDEFGRLVWPSKIACEQGEKKTIRMEIPEKDGQDKKVI